MKNSVAKKIDIVFEQALLDFEDNCSAVDLCTIKDADAKEMQRSGDTRWFKQPYVVKSHDGLDQTGNFKGQTRLYVPATIGFMKSVNFALDMEEMNDDQEQHDMEEAAGKRLACDVNDSVLTVACGQGAITLVKSTAASDFSDVSKIDGALNRIGVPSWDRQFLLATDNYNGLARDLATRGTMNDKVSKAYEDAWVGKCSGLDTFKMDSGIRCNAAAGGAGITIDTRSTASNYHTPKSESKGVNGEMSPFDNRYQRITVSSTTNVKKGDRFNIAGVTEAHHLNHRDTGVLKTYVVVAEPDDATHLVISPPIISNQGATLAEENYQNCWVSPAATAAITFLNIAAKAINPFWQKSALWITPGKFKVPKGSVLVRKATTRKGIDVILMEQFDIETGQNKLRLSAKWGVTYAQPEMGGVELFEQA